MKKSSDTHPKTAFTPLALTLSNRSQSGLSKELLQISPCVNGLQSFGQNIYKAPKMDEKFDLSMGTSGLQPLELQKCVFERPHLCLKAAKEMPI